MTTEELRAHQDEYFQKGVRRGRFEERMDQSRAKEPEAIARGHIPDGEVRVGEASADLPTTSEIMDVTAGETAPNFPVCCYCDSVLSCAQCGREQPAVAETRRTDGAGSTPPAVFADQQAPS